MKILHVVLAAALITFTSLPKAAVANQDDHIRLVANTSCLLMTGYVAGVITAIARGKTMGTAIQEAIDQSKHRAGLAGVGGAVISAAAASSCGDAYANHIFNAREQGILDYDDYLDAMCYGQASRCNDPLLDVSDCAFTGCANTYPSDCAFLVNCMGGINFQGPSGASFNDLVANSIFISMAIDQGSWTTPSPTPPVPPYHIELP